jgi:hypothetical protein
LSVFITIGSLFLSKIPPRFAGPAQHIRDVGFEENRRFHLDVGHSDFILLRLPINKLKKNPAGAGLSF